MSIRDIVNNDPTMFLVLRYIGCTVCRYDIHLLELRYREFADKGTNVVVMQSTKEYVQRDLAGRVLQFYIICDSNQRIYKELSIEAANNMEELVGDEKEKLYLKCDAAENAGFGHGEYEGIEEQLPAFFYINLDLKVIEAHYAKNIMDMPSIDEMLEKVNDLHVKG